MANELISEVFDLIAQACMRRKLTPIKDKLIGIELDDHWKFWVNGYSEPQKFITCGVEQTLAPFHAYIEFNGWPAGIVNHYGGAIAAGDLANETTFIEALKKDIALGFR